MKLGLPFTETLFYEGISCFMAFWDLAYHEHHHHTIPWNYMGHSYGCLVLHVSKEVWPIYGLGGAICFSGIRVSAGCWCCRE